MPSRRARRRTRPVGVLAAAARGACRHRLRWSGGDLRPGRAVRRRRAGRRRLPGPRGAPADVAGRPVAHVGRFGTQLHRGRARIARHARPGGRDVRRGDLGPRRRRPARRASSSPPRARSSRRPGSPSSTKPGPGPRKKTSNVETSRPVFDGAGETWRLDALNDLSFQTVVTWGDADVVRVVLVATKVAPDASRAAHDDLVAAAVRASVESATTGRPEPAAVEPDARVGDEMSRPSDSWATRRRAGASSASTRPCDRAPERREPFVTLGDITLEGLYGPWSLEAEPDGQAAGAGGPTAVDHLGDPLRPASGPAAGTTSTAPATSASRASRRSRAASTRPATAAASGRCACSPASARPRTRTRASAQLLAAGQTGLSIAYDMPTLYGYDTDDPEAEGEFGTCGVAVSSLADMEVLLGGPAARPRLHLDDDQLAGRADLGDVHRRRREGRRPARRGLEGTTQNDILKEFVAQKEFLFPPEPSMRLVTDTIEFGTRELPRWNTVSISGYHIREAGSTAGPGAGLHDRRRDGLRRGGARARAARRRLRAAPLVLLQQPQRLLRGDRQVPGRPPDLVQAHDRALRRRERALDLDALPHPDGRRLADPAAAAQQPDPGRDPGARRGARRDAVAPHRRLRRGAGRADRRGRAPRPAPAAGHRRGDRRRQHGRPARRLLVRRGAHRTRPSARSGATSTRSTGGAGWSPRSREGYPQREIADAAYRYQREFDAGERRIVGVNAYVDASEVTSVPGARRPARLARAPPGAPRADAPRARRRRRSRRRSPACATPPRGPSRARRT